MQNKIKKEIENLCFKFDVADDIATLDFENIVNIKLLLDKLRVIYSAREEDLQTLNQLLEEFSSQTHNLTDEELKAVYLKLKNRELHPRGSFDRAGRFWLDDSELVDCRLPSSKYPYSQMSAGRTAKFVKKIADKYKCSSLAELEKRFTKKYFTKFND